MERLTFRDDTGLPTVQGIPNDVVVGRLCAIEDILGDDYDLDRLRELAEADGAGRVVVLPCKVGDSVYFITGIHGKIVKDAKVEEIYIGESGFALGVSTGFTTFTIQQNEVFFTKKAAEEALKGEQNG